MVYKRYVILYSKWLDIKTDHAFSVNYLTHCEDWQELDTSDFSIIIIKKRNIYTFRPTYVKEREQCSLKSWKL